MRRNGWLCAAILGLACLVHSNAIAKAGSEPGACRYRNLGYVVVTQGGPKDGGDFGTFTPNTKTAGIQEAIDYAVAHGKNVFIAGTQKKEARDVYDIRETIRVPPTQGFCIDGGHYVINHGCASGDALRIDSCMDASYRFGLIVSRSKDAVVRFRPERPVPIDKMVVVTDSHFEFSSIVGGGVFDLETLKITGAPKGGGIVLDASNGPIVYNRITANAVLLCARGVYLTTGATQHSVACNWIAVTHNHQCNTHLQLGAPGDRSDRISLNRIVMTIDAEGIKGSIGARVFGQRNLLDLDVIRSSPGNDIVFETGAADNIVTSLHLPNGVTNRATRPTNRIVATGSAGFDVSTPDMPPSGRDRVNRNPYPISVLILTPGDVSSWTLTDAKGAAQRIQGGFSPGQCILLSPGERITVTYTKPPTWRWKAAG
jgi:hypothetical protein